MRKELLEAAIEVLKDEKNEIEFIVDHRDILNDTERMLTELHKIRRGIVMAIQHIEDFIMMNFTMRKGEVEFEGTVIPMSDYDVDCLYDTDRHKSILITSFLPKAARPCAEHGRKCKEEECEWNIGGVCKPPRYKVKVTVRYEEVDE